MSRRIIHVDGKDYNYTIGRTHTKVDGVGAVANSQIGHMVIREPGEDPVISVTPREVAWYIRSALCKSL